MTFDPMSDMGGDRDEMVFIEKGEGRGEEWERDMNMETLSKRLHTPTSISFYSVLKCLKFIAMLMGLTF